MNLTNTFNTTTTTAIVHFCFKQPILCSNHYARQSGTKVSLGNIWDGEAEHFTGWTPLPGAAQLTRHKN